MEDKKQYSIVGKVEIGTDEYRDLIEGLTKAENDLSEIRSSNWKLGSELSDAKKARDAYKEQLTQYTEFVNSSEEIKAKYALFLTQKKLEKIGAATEE